MPSQDSISDVESTTLPAQTGLTQTLKVLLIEDSETAFRLVQTCLKEADNHCFELERQATLTDGIQRLTAGGIDIVLLDLNLPDSLGLETYRRLRLDAADLPVLILSEIADADMALHAVSIGAQDFLVKGSFGPQLLIRALRHSLERHRTRLTKRTRTERENRLLLDSTAEATLIVDIDQRILLVNDHMEKMFGYTHSQLRGRSLTTLILDAASKDNHESPDNMGDIASV